MHQPCTSSAHVARGLSGSEVLGTAGGYHTVELVQGASIAHPQLPAKLTSDFVTLRVRTWCSSAKTNTRCATRRTGVAGAYDIRYLRYRAPPREQLLNGHEPWVCRRSAVTATSRGHWPITGTIRVCRKNVLSLQPREGIGPLLEPSEYVGKMCSRYNLEKAFDRC